MPHLIFVPSCLWRAAFVFCVFGGQGDEGRASKGQLVLAMTHATMPNFPFYDCVSVEILLDLRPQI